MPKKNRDTRRSGTRRQARGVSPLAVLYEDNHLLAVDKPARLPTMGVAADRPSLSTMAKEYLKRTYHKPGNVYLGIVSRLDGPVTGVVLFARTSKAAARLAEQFREHRVMKTYWAMVGGIIDPPEGVWVDWLWKNERLHRMQPTQADRPGAKLARLSYRLLRQEAGRSLVEIQPQTGRKHQIRVQLARRGHPVLGDRKYGSQQAFELGIALHAHELYLEHPVGKGPLHLVAPLPDSWMGYSVGSP